MNMQQVEQGFSQKTKDKFQYGMAGFLILSAVILAFVSFIVTLTIGTGVIAWGGLCMGTALTLIGGGMYFHNQLVTFETNANKKMEEMLRQMNEDYQRVNGHAPHTHRFNERAADAELRGENYGTDTEKNC